MLVISVTTRECDGNHLPVHTLTVTDGETRVSVNISDRKRYQLIDQHKLTAYEENEQGETIYDNKPPTESAPADNESLPPGPSLHTLT